MNVLRSWWKRLVMASETEHVSPGLDEVRAASAKLSQSTAEVTRNAEQLQGVLGVYASAPQPFFELAQVIINWQAMQDARK